MYVTEAPLAPDIMITAARSPANISKNFMRFSPGTRVYHQGSMQDRSAPLPVQDPLENAGEKPTRTRYWVLVFAVSLAVITYIDRVAISWAAPDIQHDLGLDSVQMGWVLAAFAWAYALFEIPGGF